VRYNFQAPATISPSVVLPNAATMPGSSAPRRAQPGRRGGDRQGLPQWLPADDRQSASRTASKLSGGEWAEGWRFARAPLHGAESRGADPRRGRQPRPRPPARAEFEVFQALSRELSKGKTAVLDLAPLSRSVRMGRTVSSCWADGKVESHRPRTSNWWRGLVFTQNCSNCRRQGLSLNLPVPARQRSACGASVGAGLSSNASRAIA